MGIRIPCDTALATKGIAAVVADGVSIAEAGKQAAEICVQGFLTDYFDVPDTWSAKHAGSKVLESLNHWLFGMSNGFSSTERGYVSTLSALVIKSTTAHFFHAGDSRIWLFRDGQLSQITQDHSVRIGDGPPRLTRAMGVESRIDHQYGALPANVDDMYLLTTDGIHGTLSQAQIETILRENASEDAENKDNICQKLVEAAMEKGSDDNLTALLLCIDELAAAEASEVHQSLTQRPFPPELAPGMKLDGLLVETEISASPRSQLYGVRDMETDERYVMKTPSVNYEDDPAYLERFTLENWVARKLNHKHLLKAAYREREGTFMYNLYEYIEGPTLDKWRQDQDEVSISKVIGIARDVVSGVRALHRNDVLHQDIKPNNVIFHPERGAVIIDYGSCLTLGIQEIDTPIDREVALGTVNYSAPEYKLGRKPTRSSDLFSIGILIYELLTGKHPYGQAYKDAHSLRDFSNLEYASVCIHNPMVPAWIDGALRKAVSINPQSRYQVFSEFVQDLEHPNMSLAEARFLPLLYRGSARFWKQFALMLLIAQVTTIIILIKLLF